MSINFDEYQSQEDVLSLKGCPPSTAVSLRAVLRSIETGTSSHCAVDAVPWTTQSYERHRDKAFEFPLTGY